MGLVKLLRASIDGGRDTQEVVKVVVFIFVIVVLKYAECCLVWVGAYGSRDYCQSSPVRPV